MDQPQGRSSSQAGPANPSMDDGNPLTTSSNLCISGFPAPTYSSAGTRPAPLGGLLLQVRHSSGGAPFTQVAAGGVQAIAHHWCRNPCQNIRLVPN